MFYGNRDGRLHTLKKMHLMVISVDRKEGNHVVKMLQKMHIPIQLTFAGQDISSSVIMDLLGLGIAEKTIILSFVAGRRLPIFLNHLSRQKKGFQKGKGLAFTIQLSGIGMPGGFRHEMMEGWQTEMEREVEQMEGSVTHDMVVAIVDEEERDRVIEAAHTVGITGGTAFHALRFGMEDMARVFGFPIQEKKEIVTFLVKRQEKTSLMEQINKVLGETRSFLFSLPVDSVIDTKRAMMD